MTITQMEYILAVAKERNFRKAADKCHVSQPTLSAQIQKFEENLGAVIFDRKPAIKPTRLGELVIEQMKVTLSEFHRIQELIEDDQTTLKGSLSIGVIPTIAPYLLPRFLRSFNQKYPELELNVFEMTTENCLASLDKEEIDVAVLATTESRRKYRQDELYEEEMMLYLNKDHKLLSKKKLTVDDLNAEEMWLLEEGHCLRDEVIKFCHFRSLKPSKLNLKMGNLEALRFLVSENFGYTLIPKLAIEKLPANEKKRVRELSNPKPKRTVYLTKRRQFLKARAIEALREEILDCL